MSSEEMAGSGTSSEDTVLLLEVEKLFLLKGNDDGCK